MSKSKLYSHLIELKKRVLISFSAFLIFTVFCYCYSNEIYDFLVKPLFESIPHDKTRKIIFTNLTEVFFSYLKLSCFAGFILSLPVFASQIYLFIAPALYKNEKKIFFPFLVASPLLFLMGGLFAYYVIFPLAWKFFLSFESTGLKNHLALVLEPKISEYISLVISVIIAFGLAFQIPIFLVLLSIFEIIDSNWLKQKRKISIVLIFVMAAILTPPDVISQIALAIPMMLLYELSINVCKYIEYQREKNNA